MATTSNRALAVLGAVTGVLALVVSLSGVAPAGTDLFSDIGTSPFAAQINRIGRAGCASGFPDGSFHPHDAVNRQQFAFWTNNCGGRVAWAFGGDHPVAASNSDEAIALLQIQGGGTDSPVAQGGFVHLVGTVDARVSDADLALCPCRVEAVIRDVTDDDQSAIRVATLGAVPDSGNDSFTSLSINGVFPIDPGQLKAFHLVVRYIDTQSPTIFFSGDLTALWVPFGADGDRALDIEP